MVRRIEEESFNPSETVFSRRKFTAAGHRFRPMDVFRWRNLAISQRKVKLLFDSGFITHRVPVRVGKKEVEEVIEEVTVEEDIVADVEAVPLPDVSIISGLKLLQEIAKEENAPQERTIMKQRKAIEDNRNAS